MAFYKIADLIVEINARYDYFNKNAEPYLYFGKNEHQIKLQLDFAFLEKKQKENPHLTIAEIESIYLAAQFHSKVIAYDAFRLHSSAIMYRGRAYLFSAKSGVGKSTHTRLWIESFGADKVCIINDDTPVIRLIDGKFYVYGTPFDGGTGINKNIKVPLGAVVFIEQANENIIEKIQKNKVFSYFIENSSKKIADRKLADKFLGLADEFIKSTDFYCLKCNTDISSAEICESVITRNSDLKDI